MAQDDDKGPNDRRNQNENNPFIAFRRFADHQVSSLFNNVFGLHGLMRHDPDNFQACQRRRAEEQDPWALHRDQEAQPSDAARHNADDHLGDLWARNQEEANRLYQRWASENPDDAAVEASSRGRVQISTQEYTDGRPQEPQTRSWHWDWSYPKKDDKENASEDKQVGCPAREPWGWGHSEKGERNPGEDNQVGRPDGKSYSWHWRWSYPKKHGDEVGDQDEEVIIPVRPYDPSKASPSQQPDSFEDLWQLAYRAFEGFPDPWDSQHHDSSQSQEQDMSPSRRQQLQDARDQFWDGMHTRHEERRRRFKEARRQFWGSDSLEGAKTIQEVFNTTTRFRTWGRCRIPVSDYLDIRQLPRDDVRHMMLSRHYMPLRLDGPYWAAAFEDLVRVQNGQPLADEPKQWDQSFSEWVERVKSYRREAADNDKQEDRNHGYGTDEDVERTYADLLDYGEQGPSEEQPQQESQPQQQQQPQSESQGPASELDMYEHITGSSNNTASGSSSASVQQSQATSTPSILSTLTTTERTVAPDGTVTTKVVLKKKFADGREESSETVHTTNGGKDQSDSGFQATSTWSQDSNTGIAGKIVGEVKEKQEVKKSGWFWSK